MISFALPALPALLIGLKSKLARLVSLTHYPSEDFRRLRSYTFMLLASAVAFPIVEILIRQSLIDNSGYREAGLWQAATRYRRIHRRLLYRSRLFVYAGNFL